jgi:hypothetical protein
MTLSNRGLFGKARYANLAKMVKMSSVDEARMSANELVRHFSKLQKRKYKVATKRATVQAANRANAQLRRKNLSRQKSDDFREIEMIFRNAAEQMIL